MTTLRYRQPDRQHPERQQEQRIEIILQQAAALPAADRAVLVSELMDSLHPMTSAVANDLSTEIATRIDAYDRGELATEDAADVLRDARARLKT